MSAPLRRDEVDARHAPLAGLDITAPQLKAHGAELFRVLREEAPVTPVRLPTGERAWLVSRYADVQTALKDARLVKDPRSLDEPPAMPVLMRFVRRTPLRVFMRNMLDLDGEAHRRLRRVVQRDFTRARVEALRPRIEALTHDLIDRGLARERFDVIADFALPVPMTVISEMLGIPEAARERFHRWSNLIISGGGGAGAVRALWSSLRLLRALVRDKRRESDDGLLSALACPDGEVALDDDELIAMAFLLIVAGHETTVNLIGNGVLALLDAPEQRARWCDDPGLDVSAVEELLRFCSPVWIATERYARVPVEIAGVALPVGELVGLALASANRDESVFDEPDTLDLGRAPNRHLAFGEGVHHCLGAPLARLEAQVAFRALLDRTDAWRLAVDRTRLAWTPGLNVQGVRALPLEVARR
jgi:cytochrome P450 PksS